MLKSRHFWTVYLPPHLLAAFGLWQCSVSEWFPFALMFYCLISGLGIAVGFHRYFSHSAFKTSKFWQQAMLYFGCLACHGNPLFWVALHRGNHHRYSDRTGDPHSPKDGLWHAYQGYTWEPETLALVSPRSAGSFLRETSWRWSVTYYNTTIYTTWSVAILSYWLLGSWALLAGLAVAQVWAIHQEAVVNVLGHTTGFGAYRNFPTDDSSVNRPVLGLLTWGQSLHNNHHAYPGDPNFAAKAWEFDPSMIWIRLIARR